MEHVRAIQLWFDEYRSGTLVLPDGWHGRPYDNQHRLTHVADSDATIVLVLDDRLRLTFSGLANVDANEHELVLGPFDALRFDWETWDEPSERRTEEYGAGTARIVRFPAT
jgi:hypothetical protein